MTELLDTGLDGAPEPIVPKPVFARSRFQWAEELEARLRELVGEMLSAAQIARRMGITRSAVMGKARRMKLVVGGGVKAPLPKSERMARKRAANRRRRGKPAEGGAMARRRNPFQAPALPVCEPLPAAELWQPLPGTAPVALMDLADDHCRWPIGERPDTKFCGATAIDGAPYCGIHAQHAFAPTLPYRHRTA